VKTTPLQNEINVITMIAVRDRAFTMARNRCVNLARTRARDESLTAEARAALRALAKEMLTLTREQVDEEGLIDR
jgi:hypothetical protein